MKLIRVLIVDDEVNAQNLMEGLISSYAEDFMIVKRATTLLEAVEYIKTNPVDLVFLDVEMPIHNGTKINEFLSREERPDIIFVTAYESFAIDAIRLGAFDYIVKPLDRKDLYKSLDRYLAEKSQDEQNETGKLPIATHQGTSLIPFDEILCFKADGSYTEIITVNTSILASKPLKHFEERLTSSFVRVHRSFIVNKDKVSKLDKKDSNWWIHIVGSEEMIPISRKYKGQIEYILI